MKVAFDEHVPTALVRVFRLFASENQLRFLAGGLTVESAADYAPRKDEPDYSEGDDEPWIRRFALAGGRVIISGDTNMMAEPHERLALLEEGMVVVFFGSKWSGWKFFRKCALLLHWWPVIARTVSDAEKGSFWKVPSSFPEEDGTLISISNDDRRLKRFQRQRAAQDTIASQRRLRRLQVPPEQTSMDLPQSDDPEV